MASVFNSRLFLYLVGFGEFLWDIQISEMRIIRNIHFWYKNNPVHFRLIISDYHRKKSIALSILICLQNNSYKNRKTFFLSMDAVLPPSRDSLFSLCSFIYVMTFVVWLFEWLSNIMSDATNNIAHGHCPMSIAVFGFLYLVHFHIYFFILFEMTARATTDCTICVCHVKRPGNMEKDSMAFLMLQFHLTSRPVRV